MSSRHCSTIRTQLNAYHDGTLPRHEQQMIAEHLQQCESCYAAVVINTMVADAKRYVARPMSSARTEQLLETFHRHLDQSAPQLVCEPPVRRWFPWALAVPAAAAMLFAVVQRWPASDQTLRNQTNESFRSEPVASPHIRERPGQRDSGYEQTPPVVAVRFIRPGLRVRTFQGTALTEIASRNDAKLRLDSGWIVVDYDRERAKGPLSVQTPHGNVVVRGTVFAVYADARTTTVGVRRGKVEVIAHRGESALVRAGMRVVVDAEDLSIGMLDKPTWDVLRAHARSRGSHVGRRARRRQGSAEQRSAGQRNAGQRSAEQRRMGAGGAPGHGAATGNRGDVPGLFMVEPDEGPEAKKQLREARRLWRHGAHDEATALLKRMLSTATPVQLAATEREDALYMLATIHRATGEYEQAASALQKLSRMRPSPTVRLGALEYARLLAKHIDKQREAVAVLERLLRQSLDAPMMVEATLELCTIRIELGQREAARTCLEGLLSSHPTGSHAKEARRLLEQLNTDKPDVGTER